MPVGAVSSGAREPVRLGRLGGMWVRAGGGVAAVSAFSEDGWGGEGQCASVQRAELGLRALSRDWLRPCVLRPPRVGGGTTLRLPLPP